jgi:alanine-synthesizing transaminase
MCPPPPKPLATRERLSEVRYEIRGELARRARELEAQGRKLIKLNIGNPGAFGFRAPEHLQRAIADDIAAPIPTPTSRACRKRARPSPRLCKRAARPMRTRTACSSATASVELIDLSLRALLNPGDEVLVPSPDYPLWSAATILNDGRPVYYRCAPENGFLPDPVEIERWCPRAPAPSC